MSLLNTQEEEDTHANSQVSILVLVDVALEHFNSATTTREILSVSILVLVDVALELDQARSLLHNVFHVSILVLVDVALEPTC